MKNYFFIVTLILVVFTSCSLKYDTAVEADGFVPEFILSNVNMTQYKNGNSSMQMEAERLEQYKGTSETYAKNMNFKILNDNDEVTSEGKCGLLFSDTEKKLYELYDNIEVVNHDDDTKFYADALKYNEKTEQLTGSKSDVVRIEKDGTIIFGSGFSASGISKRFTFSGTVTGDIETK